MQSKHDPDWAIRAQAFSVVERLAISTGGRIPWTEIAAGFLYEGQQIQLASRALGIFKPRQMSAALSIKTVQPRAGRPSWYRDQSAGFDAETGLLYRCAFSNLPLGKLLVGAHIKSDEDGGPASVPNGICMSALHHAAFDSYLIGVDPDLRIHVSRNVFDADDGPLLASLQGLDGGSLRVPDEPLARPDSAFLEWRFDRFEAAQT